MSPGLNIPRGDVIATFGGDISPDLDLRPAWPLEAL